MKGRRGRPPVVYPVCGRLMTIRQIAEEFGLTFEAVSCYRNSHLGPDGAPIPMQAVYERYARIRAGKERRHRGSVAKEHALPDGRRLTVAQMARELDMKAQSLYNAKRREGGTMQDVFLRRVQKKERRAVKAIVAIWMEAKTHDT